MPDSLSISTGTISTEDKFGCDWVKYFARQIELAKRGNTNPQALEFTDTKGVQCSDEAKARVQAAFEAALKGS